MLVRDCGVDDEDVTFADTSAVTPVRADASTVSSPIVSLSSSFSPIGSSSYGMLSRRVEELLLNLVLLSLLLSKADAPGFSLPLLTLFLLPFDINDTPGVR